MFKYLHFALIIWVLAISSAQAKTYIRDYTYKASDADSKITSRANALDQVKLILLQEIGTHIRQEINITKDGSGNTYVSEDVEAITAGLTKVEIIDEKWNGETYYLRAKIDADTTRVLNALKKYKNHKSKEELEALKDNQRKLKKLREEITKLRSKLTQDNGSEKAKSAAKYTDSVEKILLSDMFVNGYNFSQQGQYKDAAFWFRKSAEQGHTISQYNLGVFYSKGRGVEQNYKQAAAWYQQAADQGYVNAQYNLGVIYSKGEGVEQNYKQAAAWYRKAANQGDAYSQYNLGLMYEFNWGVERNKESAKKWYRASCNNGYNKACSYP